jgi:hypothetical protein
VATFTRHAALAVWASLTPIVTGLSPQGRLADFNETIYIRLGSSGRHNPRLAQDFFVKLLPEIRDDARNIIGLLIHSTYANIVIDRDVDFFS